MRSVHSFHPSRFSSQTPYRASSAANPHDMQNPPSGYEQSEAGVSWIRQAPKLVSLPGNVREGMLLTPHLFCGNVGGRVGVAVRFQFERFQAVSSRSFEGISKGVLPRLKELLDAFGFGEGLERSVEDKATWYRVQPEYQLVADPQAGSALLRSIVQALEDLT